MPKLQEGLDQAERFEFSGWQVLPRRRALLAPDGRTVPLGSRAFDLLIELLENGGELVGKDVLMRRVWGDIVVGENTLQVHVAALRKALGADHGFILTESGRGYRFVAPVRHETEGRNGAPAAIGRPPARHNLPRDLGGFIGREADCAALLELLAAHRLVTLAGPGGIGKTSLALQAARRLAADLPDGAWLIPLAPLATGAGEALVAGAAARAFGVEIGTADPLDALVAALQARRMLLVLDNCEHVVAAAASLAAALLAETEELTILATTQEHLAVHGEHVYRVPPLGLPPDPSLGSVPDANAAEGEAPLTDAVRLFLDRAAAVNAGFRAEAAALPRIATICRRLDGNPLAIEMAAVRAPTLGVDQLAQRLDERFRLLTGQRDAAGRQQTLRATLDWSHGLLTVPEQIALRRLAVFAGDFDLEAAEAVVADAGPDGTGIADWEMAGIIAALVDKSMLALAPSDAGAMRYRLLETTRAYAEDHLAATGERQLVAARHASHLLTLFEWADAGWEATADIEWQQRYGAALDDLRSALDWCLGNNGEATVGLALTGASARLWSSLSLYAEGRRRLDAAASRIGPATPPRDAARIWFAVAHPQGHPSPAVRAEAALKAVALHRDLGDSAGLAWAAIRAAECLCVLSELDKAETLLREALTLLSQGGSARARAAALQILARCRERTGAAEEARGLYDDAIRLHRLAGHQRSELNALLDLAELLLVSGDVDGALAEAEGVAGRLRSLRHPALLGRALGQRAVAELHAGQLQRATATLHEAAPLLRDSGELGSMLDHLALLAALDGRPAVAGRIAREADRLIAARGGTRSPSGALSRARLAALIGAAALLAQPDETTLTEDEVCALAFDSV